MTHFICFTSFATTIFFCFFGYNRWCILSLYS